MSFVTSCHVSTTNDLGIVRRVVDNRKTELGISTTRNKGHTPQTSGSGLAAYGIPSQIAASASTPDGSSSARRFEDEKSGWEPRTPWYKKLFSCFR